MKKVVAHLRKADPVLREVIDSLGGDPGEWKRARRPDDYYGALVRSIVGQQLSTKAARSIYARVAERFGGRAPTPQEILDDDPAELKAACGLSRMKVVFLRSLAEHVLNGELELEKLDGMSDEDVTAELVAVKGIGTWTADMFLMFTLGRPDVLPVGDLGIRNAVKRAYGLDAPPGPTDLERIAEPWRPHRTLACVFLWESLDAVPVNSS